jgi:hypothetical protein
MLQPRRPARQNAPYSQQLGDFFTWVSSVLVKPLDRNYRRGLGIAALFRISPGKVGMNCLRLHG